MKMIEPTPDKDARRQLGELIARARVQQELAHKDIAQRCGVDVETARDWERGFAVPHGRQWARLKGSLYSLRAAAPVWQAALTVEAAAERPDDERVAAFVMSEELAERAEAEQSPPIASPSLVDPQPPPALKEPRRQQTFGAALRVARLNAGLTQDEVGELVGVTAGPISKWETDENAPVADNWRKLVELWPELKECPPPGVRDIPKPFGNRVNPQGGRPPNGTDATLIGHRAAAGTPASNPVVAIGPRDAKAVDDIAAAGIAYAYAMRDEQLAFESVESAKVTLRQQQQRYEAATEATRKTQTRLRQLVGVE